MTTKRKAWDEHRMRREVRELQDPLVREYFSIMGNPKMGEVITLPKRVTTEEYFGGCPHCGGSSGFLNVGRVHWAVCGTHKTKWCVGENLFSGWREEDESKWQANHDALRQYSLVDPVTPPRGAA